MTSVQRIRVIVLVAVLLALLVHVYVSLNQAAYQLSCIDVEGKDRIRVHMITPLYWERRQECAERQDWILDTRRKRELRQERRAEEARRERLEARRDSLDREQECIARLADSLGAAIAANRFRESRVAHYFDLRAGEVPEGCVEAGDPDPALRRDVRVAIGIPEGAVVLGSSDGDGPPVDRVWHRDSLYYIEEGDRWYCLPEDCRGQRVDPPAELVSSYREVTRMSDERLAELAVARAMELHRAARDDRGALEVLRYALKLDPTSQPARFQAAALAARLGETWRVWAHLDTLEMVPARLLARLRADSSFHELLRSDPRFRWYVYDEMIEPATRSGLLERFELAVDLGRTVGCGEWDACEGIKEFHADLVVSRTDSDWKMILARDVQERLDQTVLRRESVGLDEAVVVFGESSSLEDVGDRLFVAYLGDAYEVLYAGGELVRLGEADRISDTDGGFPLIMSKHLPSQWERWRWEIATFAGEGSARQQGAYVWKGDLPAATGWRAALSQIEKLDAYWTIRLSDGAFVLVDLITGDRYPLERS